MLRTSERVEGFADGTVRLAHMFSGIGAEVQATSLVIVGHRVARSALADELRALGAPSVHLAGDAQAPGALVHAIYHAHRTAREIATTPALRRDFAIPG